MTDMLRRLTAAAAAAAAAPVAAADRRAAQRGRSRRNAGSDIDTGLPRAEPDGSRRTEFATMLADPVLPQFAVGADSSRAALDYSAAAERGLWRDISLARRMSGALRESEAFFETLFLSTPTAMLVASLGDGRPASFRRVNPAMSRLTGHPISALLGFGFADLEHPDQPPLAEDYANLASLADAADHAAGAPREWTRRWVHADGRDLWVSLRISMVSADADADAGAGAGAGAGSADQLVCQVEDVTARRRAEQELRAAENRFRTAFAGASQPAVLIDLAGKRPGRLLAANRAACHLLGRSDFEMTWLGLESLITASGRPALLSALDQLVSGAVAQHEGTYDYQAEPGKRGRIHLSLLVTTGPGGRPDHALVTIGEDADAVAGGPPVEAPRLRVLLVEDEAVAQKIAELLLRRFGHDVDIVGDGLQAVKAVSAVDTAAGDQPYDVVVMDLKMPVMDGFEAVRRIRAALPPEHQPVIVALTGAIPTSRDACLTAGMDGYLSKPVREVDLRGALTEVRPGRCAAAAAQACVNPRS